jgi:DNA-binding NarL/FixJ family response regulator
VPKSIRIAVVDNYPIFRQGVVQALRGDKNFVMVAEGATAKDAERFVTETALDVLLLEVAVPGSLKVAETVLGSHQNLKVVFLAAEEDPEHATRALHAGAQGYIMKGITGRELVNAIITVNGGGRYITTDLAWRLITNPALHSTAPHLNIREQQVLDYASRGLTNREISSTLGLGVSTIKHYKSVAYKKVGVRNRVQAIFVTGRLANQK